MEEIGTEVRRCIEDADTNIVQTAINYSRDFKVNIICDDTYVLTPLVSHEANVYLTSSGKMIRVHGICEKMTAKEKQYLLLAHSFSGCDTVSSIF